MLRRDLLRAGLGLVAGLIAFGVTPLARAMAKAQPSQASASSAAELFNTKFKNLSGDSVTLSSFHGKPLVLNFWATWCPPCVKEMPDLNTLHQKYSNIHIVGLAVDTASNVERFGEKVSVDYPILVAGHGGIQIMKNLGNPKGGLPFTMLFDPSGKPLKQFLGQVSIEDLDAELSKFSSK